MPKPLTPDDFQIIQQSTLFSALNPVQLQKVKQHSHRYDMKAGQFLFHQGDDCSEFFVLKSGIIKLFRLTLAGNEKVIEIIRPGQSFAEAMMFIGENHPYPIHAVALKNSEVIAIEAKNYRQILSESVEICFNMMGYMSIRMHNLLEEVDRLTLHNATFRIANFLLELQKEQKNKNNMIQLDISKQVVASQLAIKPETFSRILKQLSNKKIISVLENEIFLLDKHQLECIIREEID